MTSCTSFVTRTFLRLVYLSLFKRRDLPPAHRRSLPFCLRFFAVFLLVEVCNALCFLLDAVFFPGYRSTTIKQPIFVVGNPRSGTTLLHRVLARDEQRFFCFRTWEILCPSIVQKMVLSNVGKLDRLMGNPLRGFILRGETKRFREFGEAHRVGLFLPEEDDKLLVHLLAAADLAFLFPYGGFDRMARFDLAVDPRDQRRIMDFYVQCLRRQAYFKGKRRILLSKAPFSSGKVENLLRRFPDCRIIYLVRNPLDVVPSAISVARLMISAASGTEPEADLDQQVYEAVKFYYSYPLSRLSSLPHDRFALVNYEDLIRRPKPLIKRLYDQFGLPLGPQYELLLDQEVAQMRKYKGSHQYSLDQCRVTRRQIVSDLRPIFERFGFDTREKSAADCTLEARVVEKL